MIAFCVIIILTLPSLIQDGMFMDAMLYSSVAHNQAQGIGSFWFPRYSIHSAQGISTYHDQPPLGVWIQALFFRFLGDSMYVERFYVLLTLCITLVFIYLFWKEVYKEDAHLRKLGWLPMILWITIPVCFWSYSNNMMENTMGVFTSAAAFLLYRSCHRNKSWFFSAFISGIFVFMGTMCKGFPGFFPVALPFLYWLTVRKNNFLMISYQTAVVVLVPLTIYLVLFLIPESRESLTLYLYQNAFLRIKEIPTVDNRFYTLLRLFLELIPPLIIVTVVLFINKVNRSRNNYVKQFREFLFFIIFGLSGSLPLMITLVQKGYYLVPAFPYFAIGFSILISPVIQTWIDRIDVQNLKYKIFLLLSFSLLIGVIGYTSMQKGKIGRDKELIHDVYLIGKVVPDHTTISIAGEWWEERRIQSYLIRYFNITLNPNYQHTFCIVKKSDVSDIPQDFLKMDLPTLQYDLYRRNGN